MLARRDRRPPEPFVAGSPRALLPDEHVLVRVDRVLDLGWLLAGVEPLYRADAGRPGIGLRTSFAMAHRNISQSWQRV
jgi:hypothetical protein